MLFIVGPFLVVGWISADKAAESMQDEVGRTMLQLTKQNHATIEKTMSAVNDKTITFLDNHLLDPTGPNEFWYNIETLGDINQADEILNRWSSDGTGYTLYMMNREEKRTLFDLSNKDTGFIYFDRGEELPAWTAQAIGKRGAGAFRLIRSRDGLATVSFARSILNTQNYNEVLGFLVVSRLEVLLKRDLLSVELPEHAGIFLFNDQNELLMQAGTTDMPAESVPESTRQDRPGYFFAGEGGDRWLYAHSYEPLYRTNLVYRVPMDSITGGLKSFQWVIMALSAAYLALVLLFVLYLLRMIVKPLHRLVSITKIYEPGVPMDMGGGALLRSDEFGILYGSFMKMTRRLDRSIEDNYLMKLRQQETELATLHSQITPHLLYNTLDSIYWYALDNGNTEVGEMVMDLSILLRIGLSKGKTLIPIGEEAEHVQAYSRLQMKRYPDTFEVHWDIEDATLAYTTPKVILQPLVENAIFHGVSGMDGEGEIWIRILRVNGTIEITVADNGFQKVDAERLNEIVRGEIEDAGYGVRNVHKRIQLHFGEDYGLRYEPREGGGVKAVINLPLHEHVPNDKDRRSSC